MRLIETKIDFADAACAEEDAELFFSDHPENQVLALQICARCPVQRECLEYAIATKSHYGIYGGMLAIHRNEVKSAEQVSRACSTCGVIRMFASDRRTCDQCRSYQHARYMTKKALSTVGGSSC